MFLVRISKGGLFYPVVVYMVVTGTHPLRCGATNTTKGGKAEKMDSLLAFWEQREKVRDRERGGSSYKLGLR